MDIDALLAEGILIRAVLNRAADPESAANHKNSESFVLSMH